jgi:hypothetical protein
MADDCLTAFVHVNVLETPINKKNPPASPLAGPGLKECLLRLEKAHPSNDEIVVQMVTVVLALKREHLFIRHDAIAALKGELVIRKMIFGFIGHVIGYFGQSYLVISRMAIGERVGKYERIAEPGYCLL